MKRKSATVKKIDTTKKIWTPSSFTADVILHIISCMFIAIDESTYIMCHSIEGTEQHAPIVNQCSMVIKTVLSMQSISVMFYDVIQNSTNVWNKLYEHTRKSLSQYQNPTRLFPFDRPFCSLKEFIILDTKEYFLRASMIKFSTHFTYGYKPEKETNSLDFTAPVFSRKNKNSNRDILKETNIIKSRNVSEETKTLYTNQFYEAIKRYDNIRETRENVKKRLYEVFSLKFKVELEKNTTREKENIEKREMKQKKKEEEKENKKNSPKAIKFDGTPIKSRQNKRKFNENQESPMKKRLRM